MEPAREDDDRALVEQAFRQATFSMSIFGTDQRYLRLNEEACLVMGVGEDELRGYLYPYGVPADVDQQGMLQALRDVTTTGKPTHYESFTRAPSSIREHAWNVKLWPIRDDAGDVCAVGMAAFDSSEQHWARQRLAVLDEAALRLGRNLDLTRTAEELVDLVVPRFADFASVDLFQAVMEGDEPTSEGWSDLVALRRVAHLSLEPGTPEAAIELGGTDVHPPYSPLVRALRTGQAVLSTSDDPGLERWLQGMPARAAKVREGRARGFTVTSVLAVPLIARGTTLGVATLVRARPDPFNQDDSTLARELAGRAALCVDNARRYTRERTAALTLQRSLLPRGFVRQSAVDVACRYLPTDARAGVGGDWFDIIPLSGARVGLVVGDVVGHGIQASATMGRLRTAVQTLADVDLPPDELLAHLDDLVLRVTAHDEEAGPGADGTGETGATCLYAVYDPVSRRLTTASAGHPPPVILEPGGTTRVLDVSAGPVLGVGGLPFEATEVELPEGSLVALFTDGLVEAADHDPDAGVGRLCEVLARSGTSLESRCDALLTELLPAHPRDDVALVLARTRALHAGQVRVWDLAADVELVAEARRLALAQLQAWGLEEAAFVTELVVSELVTNAIRYGADPIQLRLIHDRTLICEVSDGNSTSPHLRRARMFDEGGRGLLLVAQLTTSWGTRQTATGKTIWAEQELV
ncbi:ATP-binding SpoIIE family protein phosphatase [Streptomyces caeruleatus]|uniref:PAS sensor protein n=1 Tax=Streptomyces caeruleatus TaxID=661399 RepID=A0A117RRG8_9ACTN|nr:SpoIIE family protein phosphatase [Streptomyces caeruleatus]KUO05240.1 PAS sensor protein [Streptomyces caeruleatus]